MNMNEAYRLLSEKTKQALFIRSTIQRDGDGVRVGNPSIYFTVTAFSNRAPSSILIQTEKPTLEAAVADVVRAIDEENATPLDKPFEENIVDATVDPEEMAF